MFEQCHLCGSTEIHSLKGYEAHFLVKCNSCSFVFSQKKPSLDELKKHYGSYPRENYISAITIKRYEELFDEFEKYRNTNNLIDVGCGDGFFLEAAKKRNWNVFGTEYTEEAIENCKKRGIEMTQSPLNPDHYKANFFDIITSFEVLEHINMPVAELRSFNKILRVGGLVYVTTPNFNSISRNILGSKWNMIEYPEHLSYYTAKTLVKAVTDAGFGKVNITTTGVSINRFTRSSGIEVSSTNMDESLRQQFEKKGLLYMLKEFINYGLNIFKKGDSMKARFIKL